MYVCVHVFDVCCMCTHVYLCVCTCVCMCVCMCVWEIRSIVLSSDYTALNNF